MGFLQTQTEANDAISPQQKLLILFLLFALIFHALVFFVHLDWLNPAAPTLPPKVELQKIDPKKLEAIKRQWKKQEQSLLINRDKSSQKALEAPDHARYFSDRNIQVEKEQRAKDSSPIVKPGANGLNPNPTLSQNQTQGLSQSTKTQNQSQAPKITGKHYPNLSQLGIRLPTNPSPEQEQQQEHQASGQAASEGGEQYIPDRNLAQGSQNLLNAQESVYYSFYSRLYDAIGPLWQSRLRQEAYPRNLNEGDYTTFVDVVLDENGNLIRVDQQKSSGIREFDLAVEESWKKIGKFPNPPKGLLDRDRLIHTGWTFTVHVGQGLFLGPPKRSY